MAYREDLEALVQLSEAEVLRTARQWVAVVELKRVGPIETVSASSLTVSWSCWIVTSDDADKKALLGDAAFLEQLQRVAAKAGLAPESITVQSQETVDRDFEGSWFYAMR